MSSATGSRPGRRRGRGRHGVVNDRFFPMWWTLADTGGNERSMEAPSVSRSAVALVPTRLTTCRGSCLERPSGKAGVPRAQEQGAGWDPAPWGTDPGGQASSLTAERGGRRADHDQVVSSQLSYLSWGASREPTQILRPGAHWMTSRGIAPESKIFHESLNNTVTAIQCHSSRMCRILLSVAARIGSTAGRAGGIRCLDGCIDDYHATPLGDPLHRLASTGPNVMMARAPVRSASDSTAS